MIIHRSTLILSCILPFLLLKSLVSLKIELESEIVQSSNSLLDYQKLLNDQVVNRLWQVSEGKRPNFHENDFPIKIFEKLELKLQSEKDSILNLDQFWYDLFKLLFDWFVSKRQKLSDNDSEFKEILKNTEKIALMINLKTSTSLGRGSGIGNGLVFPFFFFNHQPSGFRSGRNNTVALRELINCELIERSKEIFSLFHASINDFYEIKDGKLKAKENFKCDKLKSKYFNGKNFNENPFLKIMILANDPMGEMKKCFGDSDLERLFPTLIFNIKADFPSPSTPFGKYDQEREGMGLGSLSYIPFEIYQMKLLSKNIINFFLKSGKRFLIFSNDQEGELVSLLRKLKNFNLLTRENIEKLVGFDNGNGGRIWNANKFKSNLESQMKSTRSDNEKKEIASFLKIQFPE